MLTKRIIPCLDCQKGRVVKGTSFTSLRDAGDPAERARFYYEGRADELVLLDITATPEARDNMVEVVECVSDEIFIPLTVGGGLRSIKDMRRMLLAGADKVSINTAAVQNTSLITEGADKLGSQCIVVAIDAKRVADSDKPRWEVYTHSGQRPTGMDAVAWAKQVVVLGAGEILLTSIDADGHRAGYDTGLYRAVADTVSVPVIASGGAGNLEDMYEVLSYGRADAVLAASIFHYGIHSIREAKKYLSAKGMPVRMEEEGL